jgi:hypothetical protein
MIQGIIQAVSNLILSKYPGYPIYLEDLQEGFDRPSFYVPFIQETQTDQNKAFYARNIIIYIIFYAPLGGNNNPDKEAQYGVYETLRDLFSSGYFKVGDRAVKIRQLTGGPKGKEIYLGLNLDLTGSRQPSEQGDIAGSLELKFDL